MSRHGVAGHADFDKPWCQKILLDRNLEWTTRSHQQSESFRSGKVSNSMFEYTLYSDRGIRAHLSFRRPTNEVDSIFPKEDCFLISVGDGVDGLTGRAHGGFDSLLLDHISGHSVHYANPNQVAPATATMTVDYKAPVSTPCVILARAWTIEASGRKVWVKAVLEDAQGKILARAKTLFITMDLPKM